MVQPGEMVTIELSAQDQLGNYREAVWSLSRPGQETVSCGGDITLRSTRMW